MFGGKTVRVFEIVLDKVPAEYAAGDIVSGRILLDLNKGRKTTNIRVDLVGNAEVEITEVESIEDSKGNHVRDKTHYFRNSESYTHQKMWLLGHEGGPQLDLQPGHSEYKFSFKLPQMCPSSFNGDYGHIRYAVSATMEKSWGFDNTAHKILTVIGVLDLNSISGKAERPIQLANAKFICCLCCKGGPISFVLRLNRTGFVPGDVLGFVMQVNNQSNKEVSKIIICLQKNVSYHTLGTRRHSSQIVMALYGPGVKPHEIETWRPNPNEAKIPQLVPTNFGGCSIMYLSYELHVEVVIKSAFDLTGVAGILIGTIPLEKFNNVEQFDNALDWQKSTREM